MHLCWLKGSQSWLSEDGDAIMNKERENSSKIYTSVVWFEKLLHTETKINITSPSLPFRLGQTVCPEHGWLRAKWGGEELTGNIIYEELK